MTQITYRQRLGTTAEREYIVVDVTLENTRNPGTWETIDHEQVTDPITLSISGERYRAHTRTADSAGQITDDLTEIVTPAPGWTLDKIAELHALWQRWHLNTLQAGCAHVTPVNAPDRYGRIVPSLDLTPACPVTGYRYGHSWLAEELPESVIERVHHLMRDRTADLHQARGYDNVGQATTQRG